MEQAALSTTLAGGPEALLHWLWGHLLRTSALNIYTIKTLFFTLALFKFQDVVTHTPEWLEREKNNKTKCWAVVEQLELLGSAGESVNL